MCELGCMKFIKQKSLLQVRQKLSYIVVLLVVSGKYFKASPKWLKVTGVPAILSYKKRKYTQSRKQEKKYSSSMGENVECLSQNQKRSLFSRAI